MRINRTACSAVALACAWALAACDRPPAAAPVPLAAKVNQGGVSVGQVSDYVARAGQLSPEQAKQLGKQTLDRLVDQELLAQKAQEKGLDKDAKVQQTIDWSRREILARAYVDSLVAPAGKPSDAEIAEFYKQHPELFGDRRIYRLNEITFAHQAALVGDLREQLRQGKSMNEVVEWLRAKGVKFSAGSETRAAEQLPMNILGEIAKLQDGQMALVESPAAVLLVQVAASQVQPVDEAAARPAIEQHLSARKRAEATEKEVKQLREQAKIELLGDYAAAGKAPPQKETEGLPFRPPEPGAAGGAR
jgi:EpsD family peptidyl-prolyl cis-trans isomerase